MKGRKKMLGHNSNKKTLIDFIREGRCKITNEIANRYLVCNIVNGEKKETILYDSGVIGLRLRVYPGGTKSWFYDYKPNRKTPNRRYTIGSFPEIKVVEARKIAKELKAGLVLGREPRDIILNYTNGKTLKLVAEEWIKSVLKVSKRYRPGTKKHVEARLKTWLFLKPKVRLKGRTISTPTTKIISSNFSTLNIQKKNIKLITKDDLVAYHDCISKRSLSQANRVIDDLQQIFNYAFDKEYTKENVCKFKKKERNTIDKRLDTQRPYTKKEWKAIVRSCLYYAKDNSRIKTAALSLLLLASSGRRKMEIQSLRWDQVRNNKELVFKSSDTKNNKSFSVELIKYGRGVIKRMEDFRATLKSTTKKGYVFPAVRKSKKPYLHNPGKSWKLIIRKAKAYCPSVEYKCIHMLRHSYACFLLEATRDIKLVAKIMNWKSLKVAEIYADYLGEQSKEGTKKLEQFIHAA